MILKQILTTPTVFSGMLYGLGLVGFFFAGAESTAIFLVASAAPIGVLGVLGGLVGAPFLWTVIGGAFQFVPAASRRMLIVPALVVHYVSAVLLVFSEFSGHWDNLQRLLSAQWPVLAVWFVFYASGQVVMWRTLAAGPQREGLAVNA